MTRMENRRMELDFNPDYPIKTPCQLQVLLKPFFGPKERKDKWIYQKVPTSDIFVFSSEITESLIVYLAGFLTPLFGWKTLKIQDAFPDATYKDLGTDTVVRVEFEKDTRAFVEHNHPPAECDVIFCWSDNLTDKEKQGCLFTKNPNLKIIEFRKIFFHYDFELTLP